MRKSVTSGALAWCPACPSRCRSKTQHRTALSYLLKPLEDQLARAWKERWRPVAPSPGVVVRSGPAAAAGCRSGAFGCASFIGAA